MSRMRAILRGLCVVLLLGALLGGSARAQDDASMVVHLIDYLGADYAGAVRDGKIVSADEYKEMQEFEIGRAHV